MRYGAASQHIVMAAGLNAREGDEDFGEITDENYLLNKFKKKKGCKHDHGTDGSDSHLVDGSPHQCHHSEEGSPKEEIRGASGVTHS